MDTNFSNYTPEQILALSRIAYNNSRAAYKPYKSEPETHYTTHGHVSAALFFLGATLTMFYFVVLPLIH